MTCRNRHQANRRGHQLNSVNVSKPLLERLHEVGCERDTAGNRELHFDQYCMPILLYLFNPIVTSNRHP